MNDIRLIILLAISFLVAVWVFVVFLRGDTIARLLVPLFAACIIGTAGVIVDRPSYYLFVANSLCFVAIPVIVGTVTRWILRWRRPSAVAIPANQEHPVL